MPISLYPDDSQSKLIEVWKRSWAKQGFEPIVLNEGDAAQHPMYEGFKKHVWSLPTEYGNEYDGACLLRWLAMSAQLSEGGGGLMLDYDVINYSYKPEPPDPNKMQIFCEPDPIPIDMGAVLGTREHYQNMCEIIMSWTPGPEDWNNSSTYQGLHCSDLSLLVRMFEKKNFPKPDWLVKRFGVQGRFPRECFKTSPIVHYGYDFIQAGYNPKWKYIEKVRPF